MKVGSHLKQKICLGSAGLALLQTVSSFPTYAVPLKQTTTPRRFADWCLNRESQTPDAKHTVEVLLQKIGTSECDRASKQLSTLTELSLSFNEISDLKPYSNLTNLTKLSLSSNQISDLKPLSNLTNLTALHLSNNQIADLNSLSTHTNLRTLTLTGNQIADLTPLTNLTTLTTLYLDNNQVADLTPLSSLTNLTTLNLSNNQRLAHKTCPVKPDSICNFSTDNSY